MITKTIKISEKHEAFLLKNYKNATQGVAACIDEVISPSDPNIEMLKNIRAYSTRELKGKFSKAEWCFLFDSLNGTLTDGLFRVNADALVYHCEDSAALEGTAAKWDVEIEILKEKISKLTGAQVDALYTFVEGFWDSQDKDLEKWANKLI